jgi:hypothetical protein
LRGVERKGEHVFDLSRDAMIDLVPEGTTTHGFRSCFSTFCGERTSFP